jgi:hypothetical protein
MVFQALAAVEVSDTSFVNDGAEVAMLRIPETVCGASSVDFFRLWRYEPGLTDAGGAGAAGDAT